MTVMVMASGLAVIFARAAGTDTPGTTTVRVQQSRSAETDGASRKRYTRVRRTKNDAFVDNSGLPLETRAPSLYKN